MTNKTISADRFSLEKRVRRFTQREFLSSPDVAPFIERLKISGKVAIFGGLIRDLALGYARSFSSDADLVVDQIENKSLDQLFLLHKASRNRFGGYRAQKGRWEFDVWPVCSTWAFKKNLVLDQSMENMLQTTFFNWDAVLFDLDTNKVICGPQYFDDLKKRLLAINLKDTPNEIGAAVRALRFMANDSAILDPALAKFLHSVIIKYGIDELVELDQARKSKVRLTLDFVGTTAISLSDHQKYFPHKPFQVKSAQKSMFQEKMLDGDAVPTA